MVTFIDNTHEILKLFGYFLVKIKFDDRRGIIQ